MVFSSLLFLPSWRFHRSVTLLFDVATVWRRRFAFCLLPFGLLEDSPPKVDGIVKVFLEREGRGLAVEEVRYLINLRVSMNRPVGSTVLEKGKNSLATFESFMHRTNMELSLSLWQ